MRKSMIPLVLLIPVACVLGLRFTAEDAFGLPPPPPPMGPPGGPPQGGGPPPPPPPAPIAQLGKLIFFDTTLSSPAGMACATCHAPPAGFTYPNSSVNAQFGEVPGIAPGRFGNRKPPTVTYASFSPSGPQFVSNSQVWMGGQFWDGRATNLVAQVSGPLFNPNEMNNIAHGAAAPALAVQSIAAGSYTKLFQQVFGANVFTLPAQQVIPLVGQAVAAWEATPEVSPFSSKYDAWRAGKVQLSPSQANGLKLVTGSATGRPGGPPSKSAQCVQCHSIPANPSSGPDLWTSYSYFNTGVPRNPSNPYYTQTNAQTDPLGYNPLGAAYVDLGLGGFLYPANNLPAGNMGPGNNGRGDFLAVNGTFKAPTLRNVDLRPTASFVKAYSHNGVFKSLAQIVHFYNTRNLTTKAGEVIDFTRPNPYAGLAGQPLWPQPEYPSPVTLRNPSGTPGQIGNLGLSAQDEADIVNFLTTLSDAPPPPPPPP